MCLWIKIFISVNIYAKIFLINYISKHVIIFNQYINHSINPCSQLSDRLKISLVILYIVLVPMCPIHILLIQHFLLILLWRTIFYKYKQLYKRWFHVTLLLYVLYLLSALITSSHQMISFCIPYQIKIHDHLKNIWSFIALNEASIQSYTVTINRYLYIDTPFLLTRSFLLVMNYLSIYNFIMLTIAPEKLIICLVLLMRNTNKDINKEYDSIVIILLSSELINMLMTKLNNTKGSLILRGSSRLQLFSNYNYLIQLIFCKYQQFYISSLDRLTHVIYSRELLDYSLNLWLII
uniref:Uncharacterized protein n=1 Tax=Izziella formosana TaxID=1653389 RepID=A0A1G4NV06_9FLOR|nr:Hypothetical protein ORF_5 [Izziella formosana]SCW22356.1 Hypothetical protein ORF_5 [Izziella formosana]